MDAPRCQEGHCRIEQVVDRNSRGTKAPPLRDRIKRHAVPPQYGKPLLLPFYCFLSVLQWAAIDDAERYFGVHLTHAALQLPGHQTVDLNNLGEERMSLLRYRG